VLPEFSEYLPTSSDLVVIIQKNKIYEQ